MKTEKCRIIENKKVGPDFYRLKIIAPLIAIKARPGQFVHIRCSGPAGILLRRPFSIHKINNANVSAYQRINVSAQKQGWIEIFYKTVGKGTEALARKKPGEIINVIGPLGNGFSIPRKINSAILVAGGMGVAPLLLLAEELQKSNCKLQKLNLNPSSSIQHPGSRIIVLIGAKTKKELLCENEFKNLGCTVKVSTDDGSKGYKGLVTGLLENVVRRTSYVIRKNKRSTVYACGPKAMLREVSRIAAKHKIPCQVSLEEDMACGIGACYGCPVNTKQGYKLVCKDGPVFNAGEIVW